MVGYKRWEIWLALVTYEEDVTQTKQRPVLVYNSGAFFVVGYYITSKDKRGAPYPDYKITNWHSSGLMRESVIRIDRELRLLPSQMRIKLGVLHQHDIFLFSRAYIDYINKQ